MIVKHTFCGELLARVLPGGEDVAILAIRSPGAAPLRLPKSNYVAFQIELPNIVIPDDIHEANVQRAIRWLRVIHSAQRHVQLLIVCEAGRSRSAAFAEYVSDWLGLAHDGDASEASQVLLAYLVRRFPTRKPKEVTDGSSRSGRAPGGVRSGGSSGSDLHRDSNPQWPHGRRR